jgi:capsular exopolysaccharide synthesis family protein
MKSKHNREGIVLIKDFSSVASEAIQKLQTNISFANPEHPFKVIGITSSVQAEGKSTLIANLANVYAFRGAKVCLVNLDLRRPSLHHFYNVPNQFGIAEYVAGDVSIDQLIVHCQGGVDLINAGTLTPFPTKLLSSPKLDELFKALREKYDYVLADTAPTLLVTDATLCSRLVDGYLFVVAQHLSKKKNVKASLDSLESNGVNVIGIVMTQVTDFEGSEMTSDSYHYYYKRDESEEKK